MKLVSLESVLRSEPVTQRVSPSTYDLHRAPTLLKELDLVETEAGKLLHKTLPQR